MERHVDHLVVPVRDLSVAALELEAAGFVVTPRADHPFGTSNRLVVFANSYIELVGLSDPASLPDHGFARDVARFLDGGEGLSHIVIATVDAAADAAMLAAHGLAGGPVFDFSRPAPLADGSVATASFSLAMAVSTTPVGTFFCAQHTRRAVWHPSHLNHPNKAKSILNIAVEGPSPEALHLVDVAGVVFGAAATRIQTDGRHKDIDLGSLAVAGH